MRAETQATPGAPAPSSDHTSAEDRSTTFQAVQNGGEHYSGEVLLVSAYAIIWVILLGWVALVWRKQRSLNARLDDLEVVLDKAAAAEK
jgi:CcmD family protein